MTIDELARRAGMTACNIRAHQSRGLMPPPEVRGRTGFYGDEHIARLELIKDMQAEGFNLRAIQHVLESTPLGATAEVLAFRRALFEPWSAEEPEIFELAALTELIGLEDQALLDQAVKMGLLRPLDGDRYEVVSPQLLRAGVEVVGFGVPQKAVLAVLRVLQKHADGMSHAFVRLYVEHVWRPFVDAGQPEERWAEVREALDRMQPLASQSLLATLRLSMARATEEAMGAELGREEKRGRRHR